VWPAAPLPRQRQRWYHTFNQLHTASCLLWATSCFEIADPRTTHSTQQAEGASCLLAGSVCWAAPAAERTTSARAPGTPSGTHPTLRDSTAPCFSVLAHSRMKRVPRTPRTLTSHLFAARCAATLPTLAPVLPHAYTRERVTCLCKCSTGAGTHDAAGQKSNVVLICCYTLLATLTLMSHLN